MSYRTDQAITLSASDSDGDTLSYTIVTNPAHGSLSGTAPNFIYTPAHGYVGSDSFSFKANDGKSESEIKAVSIVNSFVPNMFFCHATGGDWNDVNSWFSDATCTQAAGRTPRDDDSVAILGDSSAAPAPSLQLANYFVSSSGLANDGAVTIKSGGKLIVAGGLALGYAFVGAIADATVQAIFAGDADCNGQDIPGDAQFYDSALLETTVHGDVYFYDSTEFNHFAHVLGQIKTVPPAGSNLYYCDQFNGQWSDILNWFGDDQCARHAFRVPKNGDKITIVIGTFADNPSIILASLVGDVGSVDNSAITIAPGGTLNVANGVWQGTTADSTVTVSFHGTSTNGGKINGSAKFYDSSYNDGNYYDAFISGDATYDWAANQTITVTGSNYWFLQAVGNTFDHDGNPVLHWTFLNSGGGGSVLSNCGSLHGAQDVTFNAATNGNYCAAASGSVTAATVTFDHASMNTGTVTSNSVTFVASSENDSTVIGNATFIDSPNVDTVTGSATFIGASENDGQVGGDATFTGTSSNYGTVLGQKFCSTSGICP